MVTSSAYIYTYITCMFVLAYINTLYIYVGVVFLCKYRPDTLLLKTYMSCERYEPSCFAASDLYIQMHPLFCADTDLHSTPARGRLALFIIPILLYTQQLFTTQLYRHTHLHSYLMIREIESCANKEIL